MRLAFDASVVLSMIEQASRSDPASWTSEARELKRHLARERAELFLPAPALAEVLAVFPVDRMSEVRAALDGLFGVLVFDDRAAHLTAEYWQRVHPNRKALPEPKPCLKVDCEIVGCAERWGMDGLCTRDAGQLAICRDHIGDRITMTVGPPPTFLADSQRHLFEDAT